MAFFGIAIVAQASSGASTSTAVLGAIGAAALAVLTGVVTYTVAKLQERFKAAINLQARQREIRFSKLYEKELASYETLSATLTTFIESVFALVSPLKVIPQNELSDNPNENVRKFDLRLATEARDHLLDFFNKLEHPTRSPQVWPRRSTTRAGGQATSPTRPVS